MGLKWIVSTQPLNNFVPHENMSGLHQALSLKAQPALECREIMLTENTCHQRLLENYILSLLSVYLCTVKLTVKEI